MMPGKLHFLCKLFKRMNAKGKTYYSGQLGNSKLILFPDDNGEVALYLGGQVEPEKKSFYDRFRAANGKPVDRMDGMK